MDGPAPRIDIRLGVNLTFEESGVTCRGVSQNLSVTGVLIRTTRMASLGARVRLDFQEFKGVGEVIWTRQTDDGILLGFRFVSMGWKDRKVLARYFESLDQAV